MPITDENRKWTINTFSFLKENLYFTEGKDDYGIYRVDFEKKEGKKIFLGSFFIPYNEEYELSFLFEEHTVDGEFLLVDEKANAIEETHEWFQELYKKISEIIYKRDRIRKLFIKKEEA